MAITSTGTRTLFTDDLGQPLVAGQVYSYYAGTSEPKDTYQNQDFTIPNTNPILLDDAGSAEVYLKGSYRLRVLDSNGALVDEVDNVEQEAAGFAAVLKNAQDIEDLQVDVDNINTKHIIKVDEYNRAIGHGKAPSATTYDFSIRADKLRVGIPASIELGELLFTTYDTAQTVNGATIAAGSYIAPAFIAKESITGDKIAKESITGDKIAKESITGDKIAKESITGDTIAKNAELNTPKLSATYALTTLDAPNLNLAADGTLKRSNDPLNAASRKVGTAAGNLVERDADGYPTNNNAIGVGQTWQNVKSQRAINTTYTNTTGRPIQIFVHGYTDTNTFEIEIGGNVIGLEDGDGMAYMSFVIPNNTTYKIGRTTSAIGSGLFVRTVWWELR